MDDSRGLNYLYVIFILTPVLHLMKKSCLIFICFWFLITAHGQNSDSARTLSSINKTRLVIVASGSAAVWGSSFIALNQAWYSDYPRSSFHFFNDNREWQLADKAGHLWSSYQVSRIWSEMWGWTGMKKKSAVIAGGASGIAYLSIIEIQDGYSSGWGFSWGDVAANLAGSAAYVLQELGWKEQKLLVKMSYSPFNYGNDLKERRNQLFGKSFAERILKDYNSQSYWISLNVHALTGTRLPAWLNVAVGYHAEGMLGGFKNSWTDKYGNYYDRSDIRRTKSLLISPDIDFTKIKSGNKSVRSLLFLLNMVKFPAPALQLSRGRLKGKWMYF
ncbi:MAG TPA: DUF2279 domain-containing protein [Flavitalea sp.]|nr:DUF2279 domain-containing protein [Flavitalea sp.]